MVTCPCLWCGVTGFELWLTGSLNLGEGPLPSLWQVFQSLRVFWETKTSIWIWLWYSGGGVLLHKCLFIKLVCNRMTVCGQVTGHLSGSQVKLRAVHDLPWLSNNSCRFLHPVSTAECERLNRIGDFNSFNVFSTNTHFSTFSET